MCFDDKIDVLLKYLFFYTLREVLNEDGLGKKEGNSTFYEHEVQKIFHSSH